jgi:RNA polymerase sigma-70 factor, ECF subfamily
LPYHAGVLEGAPTGPNMVLMPGGGHAGREAALFLSPAGNIIEGEPVGIAGEAQRADADAAEELFRTAYPKLAGWVRRLVDDDDTAHEIASEAFVRLLARWRGVDSPRSYLYMIATNLIRDHWRKTERERRAIRSVTAGAALDEVTFPVQDVDVRNLIASLPARLRDPFLLHYYAGFPIREVAALLHRPEGTIKADLFAARARLKTALGERDA